MRSIYFLLFAILSTTPGLAHVPNDYYSRNNYSDVYVKDGVIKKSVFTYFGIEPTNETAYVNYVIGYAVPYVNKKLTFDIPGIWPSRLCYISGNNEPFYTGWNFNAPLDNKYERTCR